MFGDSSNEGRKTTRTTPKKLQEARNIIWVKKLYHPQSTYGGRIQISRASRSEKIETRQCYSEAFRKGERPNYNA